MNRLSPREQEAVQWVTQGLSNKEIGRKLGLTEGTVRGMMHNVYNKIGVRNRIVLALMFAKGSHEASSGRP